MYKLASVALTAVLGVAGIAGATSANADPYRAELVVPRVVVEPFAYAGFYPRYYAHGPYGWRREYGRRWGYGWDRHFYRR